MLFEQKKIRIETLSEYLAEVRSGTGFSLEEVAKKTGIKLKFLGSLEKADFKTLPAEVYVYGFLRQLASLYSINPEVLIDQYKKEKGIQQQLAKQVAASTKGWPKKIFDKLIITPKILTLVLGLTFVAASVAYIIWQVWSINKTPSLQIFEPANNAAVESSSIEVSGKTDPGMTVTVNGQNIFVDNQGSFQTQIGLTPGPKQIVVTADNRFNKSQSDTINVTGEAATTTSQALELQLRVDFTAAVVLGFTIDNQPQQSINFNAGDSKIFTANQEIILSTSNAGATKVTLNGQALGAMGRPNEALSNIPFFAQTNSIPSGN